MSFVDSNLYNNENAITSNISSDNEYILENRQEIAIWCEEKKLVVTSPLTTDISTSINNQWQDYFQGGMIGGAMNLLDTINDTKSAWQGVSLHQPFMSRKVWKGTNPLSFNLELKFVAINDAKTDVFDKVNNLISMCTACDLGTLSDEELKNMNLKSTAQFEENKRAMKDLSKNTNGKGNGITKAIGSVGTFYYDSRSIIQKAWGVPGPSLIYRSDNGGKSRATSMPVSMFIPFFGNLTNCYIDNANITFNRSLDKNGYPLSAKVDIHISKMDSLICEKSDNGSYAVVWDYNYENETLNKFQTAVTWIIDGIEQMIDGVPNLITAVAGRQGGIDFNAN